MKLPPSFEMTATRSEFLRLLPAAVNHASFMEVGEAFVHRDGPRCWRIGFAALPQLQLGLMRLERHRVDFNFEGYSAAEIAEFMERFELHFRRGGG